MSSEEIQLPQASQLPRFVEAPQTSESIPFHNLEKIDISSYDKGADARKALAAQVEEALRTQGFLYLVNTGFPKEKHEDLLAISYAVLTIPQEEQFQFLAGGRYSDDDAVKAEATKGGERGDGFKPQQYWAMKNGVRDNITHYNFNTLLHPEYVEAHLSSLPQIVRRYWKHYAEYFQFLHHVVIPKLTHLIEISLEVPEGTIAKFYRIDPGNLETSAGGTARAMLYHGMTPEEDAKVSNEWLRGHSDSSALTFITSQPIVSLQFRDYHDGHWKYVNHVPGSLIVNVGDQLEFLTGSYYKATIHRVVKPPKDQSGSKRLTLIYFSDFRPDTIIDPDAINSPKLERLGFSRPPHWNRITSKDWAVDKSKLFGKKAVNAAPGDKPNEVLIAGRAAERWHQKPAEGHGNFSNANAILSV